MEKALQLIKSISDSEIDFICHADYGHDVSVHKIALRKLIFENHCVVGRDEYWYPWEVVELARWELKEGHEREFAICNALIAVAVINGSDRNNSIDYMLETLSIEYDKLPTELKQIVTEVLFSAHGHGHEQEVMNHQKI
jgi:hypothetical protein